MSRLSRFARAVVIGAGIGAACVWRVATEFKGRNDGALAAGNADPDAGLGSDVEVLFSHGRCKICGLVHGGEHGRWLALDEPWAQFVEAHQERAR